MGSSDLAKFAIEAQDALRANGGDVNRTAPKLAAVLMTNAARPQLIALVAFFLERFPAEQGAAPAPGAEPAAPEAAPEATPGSRARPGQPPKAIKLSDKPPTSQRREGPHRTGGRSASKKAATLAVAKAGTDAIFSLRIRGHGAIGDMRINQLSYAATNLANTAGSFLQRGYDDAVHGVLLMALSKHCVAADQFAKVVDVIPARVLKAKLNYARVKAVEIIQEGSARVAKDISGGGGDGTPELEGAA